MEITSKTYAHQYADAYMNFFVEQRKAGKMPTNQEQAYSAAVRFYDAHEFGSGELFAKTELGSIGKVGGYPFGIKLLRHLNSMGWIAISDDRETWHTTADLLRFGRKLAHDDRFYTHMF